MPALHYSGSWDSSRVHAVIGLWSRLWKCLPKSPIRMRRLRTMNSFTLIIKPQTENLLSWRSFHRQSNHFCCVGAEWAAL
jgi:hypothetical protein